MDGIYTILEKQESVEKIEWCKFGVTRAVFSCFRYLAEMKHDWKYYQVNQRNSILD